MKYKVEMHSRFKFRNHKGAHHYSKILIENVTHEEAENFCKKLEAIGYKKVTTKELYGREIPFLYTRWQKIENDVKRADGSMFKDGVSDIVDQEISLNILIDEKHFER